MSTAPKLKAPPAVTLASFQAKAVEGLADAIRSVALRMREAPLARRQIAMEAGVSLLASPTGSGKTLMLGRTLAAVRGGLPQRCVWFWFTPYAGLVAQTKKALADMCPELRLRTLSGDDGKGDRDVASVRDGDVFVQTWAAVATNRAEARVVRRASEEMLSLDEMLAALRADGVHIGVVIDEAHVNFGVNAKAAASFYLDVLQPDFTLLATATPNDDKLEAFEEHAGIKVASVVTVAREEVVKAALNKRGLMLGVLEFNERDRKLIDVEQATLQAAWLQHREIKRRLDDKGVAVTPLMLVQVEDQEKGGPDPIKRVREKLLEIGVPESVIATHTSGEPDPAFHTLAYDPHREVLIFKVAAATGFDAPRAWTLVSVRPNRGKDFGLQVVGRIMRVHAAMRVLHGTDDVLDRGYVFLTDPTIQEGLDQAAHELEVMRSSIQVVADDIGLYRFTNEEAQRQLAEGVARMPGLSAPPSYADRAERLARVVQAGHAQASLFQADAATQDRAIIQGEFALALGKTPLFGDLPESSAPVAPRRPLRPPHSFPLRRDLGIPKALLRETVVDPLANQDRLVKRIASIVFENPDPALATLNRVNVSAELSLRDLFLREFQTQQVAVRMSAARIAQEAQEAYAFSDLIDERVLIAALLNEFSRVAHQSGVEADTRALRRALDLYALGHKDELKEAARRAQADTVDVTEAEPVPESLSLDGDAHLLIAQKGAYQVYPNMNNEERAFAKLLDEDRSGRVKWWLRLQENTTWAPTLIRPNGGRFFPDFAVGFEGRASQDNIALVEIKDDGQSGRLHSLDNREKIQLRHRAYLRVIWAYRSPQGNWLEAALNPASGEIAGKGQFHLDTLGRTA